MKTSTWQYSVNSICETIPRDQHHFSFLGVYYISHYLLAEMFTYLSVKQPSYLHPHLRKPPVLLLALFCKQRIQVWYMLQAAEAFLQNKLSGFFFRLLIPEALVVGAGC